jgi:nucleotide-binding universal stress UspA family protein
MNPIKNILVPLDFSLHSSLSLLYGVDLARQYGASLELVYVYQSVTYALPEGYLLVTPDQLAEILSKFQFQLEGAKQQALAAGAAQVTTALLQGDPAHEIVERAKERHHDLIVMGTNGRTGLKRVFLGSVAEYVVRTASCPVLTVRAPG